MPKTINYLLVGGGGGGGFSGPDQAAGGGGGGGGVQGAANWISGDIKVTVGAAGGGGSNAGNSIIEFDGVEWSKDEAEGGDNSADYGEDDIGAGGAAGAGGGAGGAGGAPGEEEGGAGGSAGTPGANIFSDFIATTTNTTAIFEAAAGDNALYFGGGGGGGVGRGAATYEDTAAWMGLAGGAGAGGGGGGGIGNAADAIDRDAEGVPDDAIFVGSVGHDGYGGGGGGAGYGYWSGARGGSGVVFIWYKGAKAFTGGNAEENISDGTDMYTFHKITTVGETTLELIQGEEPGELALALLAADICFPAGTPVTTDQGPIAIEKLIPGTHTIKDQPIVGISQTKSTDDHLLCFEKHALGPNIPDQQTTMSREHCILYKGKMKRACTFMRYARIRKMKYTGDTLYNVVLEKHGSMSVNNMTVETLHPKHWVAKKISTKAFGKTFSKKV